MVAGCIKCGRGVKLTDKDLQKQQSPVFNRNRQRIFLSMSEMPLADKSTTVLNEFFSLAKEINTKSSNSQGKK